MKPQASTVTLTAWAPGMLMQPKSLPATLPALRNSPFIQSPWICISALPVMTRLVVTFQSRFGEPSSVCCWNWRKMPSTFFIDGLSKTAGSGFGRVEAVIDVGAVGGHQGMEEIAFLPFLAADRDRDEAGGLDLVEIGPDVVHRFPGGRVDARLGGNLLVVEEHAVEVDRDRRFHDLAVDGDVLLDGVGEIGVAPTLPKMSSSGKPRPMPLRSR